MNLSNWFYQGRVLLLSTGVGDVRFTQNVGKADVFLKYTKLHLTDNFIEERHLN